MLSRYQKEIGRVDSYNPCYRTGDVSYNSSQTIHHEKNLNNNKSE